MFFPTMVSYWSLFSTKLLISTKMPDCITVPCLDRLHDLKQQHSQCGAAWHNGGQISHATGVYRYKKISMRVLTPPLVQIGNCRQCQWPLTHYVISESLSLNKQTKNLLTTYAQVHSCHTIVTHLTVVTVNCNEMYI